MKITHEGLETQSVVQGDIITKTTRRTFPDRLDANTYARDALMYEETLRDQGYLIPQTLGMDAVVLANGNFKLVHTTDYIRGRNLTELSDDWPTRLAASQEAIRTIATAGTHDGSHLVAPLDAKPDNFVRQEDSGDVYFVDILPPLLSESTGRLTYGYSRDGRSPVGRVLLNRYVNDQSGTLTRFGTITIAEQYGIRAAMRAISTREPFEQLFATSRDVPNVEKMMTQARHKVPSFLGYTALRRAHAMTSKTKNE